MGSAYPLAGCSILVVEDEPLIALEMATLFQSAGAQVVSVRTCAEARVAIEQRSVCAAVLDYRLGDDNVGTLCARLAERQMPFMFYSGYDDLEESFPKSLIVQKPATGNALISAITGLVSPAADA
jgi:DNA-binding NtrC family response regulator